MHSTDQGNGYLQSGPIHIPKYLLCYLVHSIIELAHIRIKNVFNTFNIFAHTADVTGKKCLPLSRFIQLD